jgi:hypothetical protein
VELRRRGNIGGTLKKNLQNIAKKPRTNLAFIRRMGNDGGEVVELRRRVT